MNYISLSTIFCILFAIIAFWSEKKILNPVTVFCGLWGIVIFLSSLHLYNLFSASMKIYDWIFLGIISYVFGYYVVRILSKGKAVSFILGKRKTNSQYVYKPKYTLLYVLIVICFLFYLKDIITMGVQISSIFNLTSVQEMARGVGNVSSIESAMRLLIIEPFFIAVIPITAIDFWFGKRDRKLFILTIVLLISKVLSSGGRSAFIQFFFCLFVGFTFIRNKEIVDKDISLKKVMKKNRKRIIIIAVIAFIVLLILSLSRAGANLVKTIYFDFAMPPYMFETWAEKVDVQNLYGYGIASLNGVFYLILYIAKNLLRLFSAFPESYQKIYDIVLATDTEWSAIGNGVFANAYVSIFWFLYLDARQVGIVVGMFLYGILLYMSFSHALRKTSERNVCLYALILMGIFYSFVRMQFTLQNYFLGIIFVFLLAYKKNRKF